MYVCMYIIFHKKQVTGKLFEYKVTVSVILYGCTILTGEKRLEIILDGNYIRMQCAVLNKTWNLLSVKLLLQS